ncbi:unnamed protein product [Clonostachys rhizophaga]|uniref:DUF3533 domain-containing protein n=1 Tax=Clonostachys rhizophaga TaxID=160324 RepID=A0A9N9UY91_9HYPO|nr:unnamed protein product [Clonostachys rhizophaga]
MSFLPPRSLNRRPAHSTIWAGKWKLYIIPIIMSGFLLQILFLGNMSYLYGALFNSSSRMHNLKVLAVDFDGGDVGRALSGAYSNLQSDEFPTVEFASPSEYPTPDSLRNAVCEHGYWGAVYTSSGATDRVLAAIEGDNTTIYDASEAMAYIYNGIYYPAVVASVRGSLQSLVGVTSKVFPLVSSDAMAAINTTNLASAATLLNPIDATAWDIMPTTQGARVLLNSVSLIMPILMQFFFIMGVNAITANAKVLDIQSKRDVYIFRLCASKLYSFVSSLCIVGYIWAFRENWGVTAGQFCETWMCLWLYMDINYMVIDTIIGTIIPMSFFAYFLLTWVIFNIATVIYPFDLTPDFYHWGWGLPAHSVWLLLVSIWSNGCRAQLDVTLPVLFAWWFVGHFTSAWSVRKRCLMAEAENEQANNNDKYIRSNNEQIQQFVLETVSSRDSRQENNDRTLDNYDVEANRLGVSHPEGSDSRTVIDAPAPSQDTDVEKK